MNTEEQIQSFRAAYESLRAEIGKVIVGHDDIVEGTLIAVFGGGPVLSQGVPCFAPRVLPDKTTRAPPKTQPAILEAMQEKSVTAGGEIRRLAEPFFVLATQNPIDQEGTYPLPEAHLDRFFFKVLVGYPSGAELTEVLTRTTEGMKAEINRVLAKEQILELQKLVRQV